MGLFKKARKKRIKTKLDKLYDKKTKLEGDGYGFILPEWDKGGKELLAVNKKIWKLEDRLKEMKVGGPMFNTLKDQSVRIPGMYGHLDRKGSIKPK